jgi:hypothetical protein
MVARRPSTPLCPLGAPSLVLTYVAGCNTGLSCTLVGVRAQPRSESQPSPEAWAWRDADKCRASRARRYYPTFWRSWFPAFLPRSTSLSSLPKLSLLPLVSLFPPALSVLDAHAAQTRSSCALRGPLNGNATVPYPPEKLRMPRRK